MICPHETPGGAQRCALCRREVERLHDPHGTHADVPLWKQALSDAERHAVPMPDSVRALARAIAQGEPVSPGEQEELL